MLSLRINILNPKATMLLKSLEEMKLISIQEETKNSFVVFLSKLRNQSQTSPSLDEITKEVEKVRAKRYGK